LTLGLLWLGLLVGACHDGPADTLTMDAPDTYGVIVLRPGPLTEGQTGWVLEWRRGGEPWAVLVDAIPTSWTGIQVSMFDQPEQTLYQFRVQPFGPGWQGKVSNVLSFRLGVRPPSSVWVAPHLGWRSQPVAIRATWGRASLVATRERMERALIRPDGTLGPWTPVEVPPGVETTDDRDLSAWIDGAQLQYRVASEAAGELSAWHSSNPSDAAPIPAPSPFTGAATTHGQVHLEWTFRSKLATQVQLSWSEPIELGAPRVVTLPAWTHVVDSGFAPGLRTFVLQAVQPVGFMHGAVRTSVTVAVAPEATAARFDTSGVDLPPGSSAVRLGTGGFALLAELENGARGRLALPAGADWSYGSFESPVRTFGPGVRAAADGAVHTVGAEADERIVHLRHDAGGFHQEEVAPAALGAYGGVAGMTDDGRPLAAWRAKPGVPGALPTLATRGPGGWTLEPMPADALGEPVAIAAEPSGTIQILLFEAFGAPCTLASRAADGTWSTVATPIIPAGGPVHLLSPGDGASILVQEEHLLSGDRATWVSERDAGGWKAPVRIGAGRPAAAALSADRQRLVIVTGARAPAVHLRDVTGWTETPLIEGDVTGHAAGFGPAGEAWVLSGLGLNRIEVPSGFALFEERAGP